MRTHTITIDQLSTLVSTPPWTLPLDPEGRLVMAAVELAGDWSIYLAFDGQTLPIDPRSTIGSSAPN